MVLINNTFPTPSADAAEHSQQLVNYIEAAIEASQGQISFSEYMQQALYAPGLGYYSAGSQKFGKQGDFITAPEISSLFSICLAKQCQAVLEQLGTGNILEVGAGSGIMAADILLALKDSDSLPEHYFILEISAELRERQKNTLLAHCPDLHHKVIWLNELPAANFVGIILANEVIDAMPVHIFEISAQHPQEAYVCFNNQKLTWTLDKLSTHHLANTIDRLQSSLPHKLSIGYRSEINLYQAAWIKSISSCLTTGLLLICDYGFARHEYYHPQRHQGTLMCHYRHVAHSDPFVFPGLQDITAHVEFTSLAEAAESAGLEVSGYIDQGNFLLNCGIIKLIPELTTNNLQHHYSLNQQLKRLILPQEMGESFKVIAFTRKLSYTSLVGFKQADKRHRLYLHG